uniref:Uncharacterized protein n=1 Tax=Eutreptiella gymnastica TaxID=73025 RepID=A0A7S1I5H9_9EUGL|mmetsp:Transcript_131490/g.227755  ORF Transcript_131490/g.227755 Transcript_131490/m.227755 type:complete len:394 (+) Transcript_131490:120-1301(+)
MDRVIHETSLQQQVLAAVENAGPPLLPVSYSKGEKARDNKVLLPAECVDRLSESIQLSRVDSTKVKGPVVQSREYIVGAKPQEASQLTKRFCYPADRHLREHNIEPALDKRKSTRPPPPRDSGPLTSLDFLQLAPKKRMEAEKTLISIESCRGKYCTRHRPLYAPRRSDLNIGFPQHELRGSAKRVQQARSGESHILSINVQPKLEQVLPIIGLYNPTDRVPLRCGYAPLDLNPGIRQTLFDSTTNSAARPALSKNTDATLVPHVWDTGSPAAPQAITGLAFWLTKSKDSALLDSSNGASTPDPVKLPALRDSSASVTQSLVPLDDQPETPSSNPLGVHRFSASLLSTTRGRYDSLMSVTRQTDDYSTGGMALLGPSSPMTFRGVKYADVHSY